MTKPKRDMTKPVRIRRATKGRDNPYAITLRAPAENPDLTWAARGLLWYLLVKPDDWEVIARNLVNESPHGRDYIYGLLGELEGHGYLVRVSERTKKGRYSRHYFEVYESPQTSDSRPLPALPDTVPPDTVPPDTVNPDHTKKEVTTKNEQEQKHSAKGGTRKAGGYVNETTGVGTKEILACYEKVMGELEPGAILNWAQEGVGAKKIAQAGYEPQHVEVVTALMKREPFWGDKHLSLQTVAKEMGARLHGKDAVNEAGRRGSSGDSPLLADEDRIKWEQWEDVGFDR